MTTGETGWLVSWMVVVGNAAFCNRAIRFHNADSGSVIVVDIHDDVWNRQCVVHQVCQAARAVCQHAGMRRAFGDGIVDRQSCDNNIDIPVGRLDDECCSRGGRIDVSSDNGTTFSSPSIVIVTGPIGWLDRCTP